jgi:cytochrome P450
MGAGEVLCTLGAVLASAVWWACTRLHVPFLKPNRWLLGMWKLHKLGAHFTHLAFTTHWNGPGLPRIFRLWFPTIFEPRRVVYVVNEAELVVALLAHPSLLLTRSPTSRLLTPQSPTSDLYVDGLFMPRVTPKWHFHRRLMEQTLHHCRVRGSGGAIKTMADELESRWAGISARQPHRKADALGELRRRMQVR